MASETNAIQGLINNALMQTHTGFFATVLNVSGNRAKIQPLNMIQAKGEKAKKQAVIADVPILQHLQKTITCQYTGATIVISEINAGDTVYCLCAERDSTETCKGVYAVPVKGRHMITSAVIIGKF